MLGQVLEELNLAGSNAALRYYINITTGDSLSIAAFIDDERFCQVKASEFLNLAGQYQRYSLAWSDFPAIVPRLFGYRARNEWSMIVSEGVHHVPIRRKDVLRTRWQRTSDLREQLWAYFGVERCGAGADSDKEQSELMACLAAHFDTGPLARVAEACLGLAEALEVEAMPRRPQHGDFVTNNLGRSGNRLVVFDWEDYTKVGLPGFDLCTLCLSLLGGGVSAVQAMMRPARSGLDGAAVAFLEEGCRRQGIDLELFRRLVPFYLLVFLYLKRNYGPSVQNRIIALLCALDLP